jgi:putative DNA primase/helicase
VQGETSEAGLRQTLCHDAIPVVFDEAEGNDEKNQNRMQAVLGLMRTASTDDGGLLIKGSAGGQAKTYKIRSCFLYASIVVQLKEQSDKNRVSVLGMVKRTDEEAKARYTQLEAICAELITPEFCKNVQSRTVQMLPIILKNISVFRAAVSSILSDNRTGDQLGTLLAGAYSLVKDTECTFDEAIEWLKTYDLKAEKEADNSKDQIELLNHIMQVTLTIDCSNGRHTRNIGELIRIAGNMEKYIEPNMVSQKDAYDHLNRCGIKVKAKEAFIISNQHTRIKEWLKKTPWYNAHGKVLARLDGAEKTPAGVQFADGSFSRGIIIPLIYVKEVSDGYAPEIPIGSDILQARNTPF